MHLGNFAETIHGGRKHKNFITYHYNLRKFCGGGWWMVVVVVVVVRVCVCVLGGGGGGGGILVRPSM